MPSHAASATHVVRRAGDERAAERRDRAERAAPVAARGELEVGAPARPTAASGPGRAPRRGRGRATSAAAAGRSTGEIGSSVRRSTGHVRGRGVAAEHVVEPFARAPGRRRSRARHRPRAGCRPAPCRSARPGSRRRPPWRRSRATSDAASRVSIESFLACSTKPQVLTTMTSGASGPLPSASTSSQPLPASRPASSSESTSLRAQPSVSSAARAGSVFGQLSGCGHGHQSIWRSRDVLPPWQR